MTAAGNLAKGDERVVERVKKLKEKIVGVEIRSDLKEVLERAVKNLDSMQNGI